MSLFRTIFHRPRQLLLGLAASAGLVLVLSAPVAAGSTFPPESASGSVGLEGTISTAPPTKGATITTPVNGATFTQLPVTINGLCPNGLLIKAFANNVFVGSTVCANGSYTMQIDLFSGQDDIVVRVYDALDQSGPDSNSVTVNYVSAQFAATGTQLTLSSSYAERGAPPGEEIDWPISISGGIGPYAVSVDWGDNTPAELVSTSFAGPLTIKHSYKTAGSYKVIVTATDSKGNQALLQLIGVANGATSQSSTTGSSKSSSSGAPVIRTQVLWWPAIAMVPLIGLTFWVGQRFELHALRKQLEKTRDSGR